MKKKVDVFCAAPFVIDKAPFAGKCLNVILDVDTIRMCLLNKAFVWELSKDGKRIPLDFSNYRLDNGGVVDNDIITSNDIRNKVVSHKTVVVEVNNDGETVVKKEKTVNVDKKEPPKPVVFSKEKKPEVVVEKKKEEVKEEIKVEAIVEQPIVEDKKSEEQTDVNLDKLKDSFDKKYDKNNKHKK